MGFLEVLAIVFIILKALGLITWSWWIVLLPLILRVIFWLLYLIV